MRRRFIESIAAGTLRTPIAVALLALGCANATPAPEATAPAAASSSPGVVASTAATSAASSTTEPSAPSAATAIDAGVSTDSDASAGPAEERADNKVLPPSDSSELQERAKALFEAIVQDDPSRADPFWFPKPPFIPLKDVKDPGKYWTELHAAYGRDIHALHKKRPSWDGATFERFELGSAPKWVKPGEEANRIGYYRSFHGHLRYAVEGGHDAIDVHTVISWQGRYFVTHLSKFKK